MQALPQLAALLGCEKLRPELLEGLIAGLGGLDARLAAASTAALVAQVRCQQARHSANMEDDSALVVGISADGM